MQSPTSLTYRSNCHKSQLDSFDLQGQRPRVETAQRQIAPEEPKPRMTAPTPHSPRLALVIEPPHIRHPIRQAIPKDLPRRLPHVLIPRRENNLIGFQLRVIRQDQAVGFDALDRVPMFDLDLSVGDELRGADVEVVAAAAAEVLHEEASAVGAAVDSEAGGGETLEERPIAPGHFGRRLDLEGF